MAETDTDLPRYETIENESNEFYYGVEVALNAAGRLFLQCDKYRDYFALDYASTSVKSSDRVDVYAYAHDEDDLPETTRVVGSIAPTRFMLFKSRKIAITVKTTFYMTSAAGPQCVYSCFSVNGHEYIWRIKYDVVAGRELVRYCVLLKNEKLVASFVANRIEFINGVQSLGNLFIKCHPAQWPSNYGGKTGNEDVFVSVGYHEKDEDANLILISFVALWLRVLKESLEREPHELLLTM